MTCTFVNAVTGPTAADVSIAGRITDEFKVALPNVVLYLQSTADGEVYVSSTNAFGYYTFDAVPSGEAYVLTLSKRGYTFETPNMLLNLDDNIQGLDFIAFRDP
mgnify:CR=1 FL=1